MKPNIHQGNSILTVGAESQQAEIGVILLHGRGASAQSMIPLSEELQIGNIRFFIPQAGMNRWYPQTAFGPIEPNQPDLDQALGVVADCIKQVRSAGMTDQQIVLGGFSQGACLAAEFAVRNPTRYGGAFIFSGGLIGPVDEPRQLSGSFQGTPVFIGGSDVDPWIPLEALNSAAKSFQDLNARVTLNIYPGMPHTVNQDQIEQVKKLLKTIKEQTV